METFTLQALTNLELGGVAQLEDYSGLCISLQVFCIRDYCPELPFKLLYKLIVSSNLKFKGLKRRTTPPQIRNFFKSRVYILTLTYLSFRDGLAAVLLFILTVHYSRSGVHAVQRVTSEGCCWKLAASWHRPCLFHSLPHLHTFPYINMRERFRVAPLGYPVVITL
jgi:hypothetical protein